jgi:hypothetical protein
VQDGAGIVDKTDLVAKVKEAAAAGPEGAAPEGYIFDAATGYYLSAGVLECAAGSLIVPLPCQHLAVLCGEQLAEGYVGIMVGLAAASRKTAPAANSLLCRRKPANHYWLLADTGMYWDPASGGFYNGGDGKWYSWDGEKKEFVEWKQ